VGLWVHMPVDRCASCVAGVDVLLNKESKRETPSVITFTSKQRMMGTDAGGYSEGCSSCPWTAAADVQPCGPRLCC
jgi:hypothetical protein